MIRISKPGAEMKNSFINFYEEMKKENPDFAPSSVNLQGRTYEKWLEDIKEDESNPKDGFVPASTYLLLLVNKVIGACSIRHELNDYLLSYGGHIGYGIHPKYRRSGYGTLILKEAVSICRSLDIKDILVTCNSDNIGSKKIILKNKGILDSTVTHGNFKVERYWIKNDF
jgi:predicted acetyltransferase